MTAFSAGNGVKLNNIKTLIYVLVCQIILTSSPVIAADITIGQRRQGNDAAKQYAADLQEYARYTHAVSGGFRNGNKVFIKIGNHVFYENVPHGIPHAGVYVVAVSKNRVLLQNFYNTYFAQGASMAMARDIAKLPEGSFVVVAVKDEGTRNFDKAGQKMLNKIGAGTGLLNQEARTSYLCLGIKGLNKGMAIEKVGMDLMEHKGENADEKAGLIFKKIRDANISSESGRHKGLMIDQTEVLYYIPKTFDPLTAEYLFLIHETRNLGVKNALNMISHFERFSNAKNIVLIAPVFSSIYSRKVSQRDFKENGTLKRPDLLKNRYLSEYSFLVNRFNKYRSDTILIETFELFNKNLMERKKFSIYGHFSGGEFLQRFVLFHPELIDTAVGAFIGSYAFPLDNIDYPYGLKMDDLVKTFHREIDTNGLMLQKMEIYKKLDILLDIDFHIIAVENDRWIDKYKKTQRQGKSYEEKANNFYKELQKKDRFLKDAGMRAKAKKVNTMIHIIPGLKSSADIAANEATKLLFITQ